MNIAKLKFENLYKIDSTTGCWNWTGARNNPRYPIFWDVKTNNYRSARRISYERSNQTPLTEQQRIIYTCGNSQCVNPQHLTIRTEDWHNTDYSPRDPAHKARGPRPQTWVTGRDPVEHKKYRVWIQQRNQAQWRGEGWDFSFADWKQLWGESWLSRGRERGSYCMTRIDPEQPWSRDNCCLITRENHAKNQAQAAAQGHRSPAQARRRARLGLPV